MGEQETGRVWKPSVELAGPAELPHPGGANQSLGAPAQQPHYTKTSLEYDATGDQVFQLNRHIQEVSEAHNSVPRPFVKQTSLESAPLNQERASFTPPSRDSRPAADWRRSASASLDHQQRCERRPTGADMNSKLVHKQYNSPIDMYSMSNIRQAIEAQSELLAPGVKGINFMKADSPVNKQSEVLKLIQEEEAERRRQQSSSVGAQQQPTVMVSQHERVPGQQERVVRFAREQKPANWSGERSLAEAIQQSVASNSGRASVNGTSSALGEGARSSPAPSGRPKCCECGQFIVGPFARIQDRCVHPHCFNCSTCGNSLKNTGYFTINDKLYCDIHARQVANVMRLNYNFEPNKQTVDNTRQQYEGAARAHQERQQQQQHQLQAQQQQQVVVRHQATDERHQAHSTSRDDDLGAMSRPATSEQGQRCSNCCVTLNSTNQTATISTMFSNRAGGAGCTCGRRGEIKWVWRPCRAQQQQQGSSVTSDSSFASSASNVAASQQHQVEHHKMQQQQQLTGTKYQSRLLTASDTQTAGTLANRMPVCCHCQMQIHGPYVLAGKTIWCKPCSQANFVCSSCHRSLLDVGFVEDGQLKNKYYCEHCFEAFMAPVCAKCHLRITDQDCLKALGKSWHLNCFVCAHCKCQFGNSSFYLEDNLPYCQRDWNLLFTTKCCACNYSIEAGDKWIEALSQSYHSDCFRCNGCQVKLEGSSFYCRGGKPYCRMHAR